MYDAVALLDGIAANCQVKGVNFSEERKSAPLTREFARFSVAGMTVIVADGMYEPINTGDKAITIQSVNGAASTIIDGGYPQRVGRALRASRLAQFPKTAFPAISRLKPAGEWGILFRVPRPETLVGRSPRDRRSIREVGECRKDSSNLS